jgi:tripartite-type tricarboxylate transporter receptor subunit TctC
LAALIVLAPLLTRAQSWKPEKPVELIVGTTPGGPQDRQGRLIQRIFQERKCFDQPSSVSNKPGGGGAAGLAYMANHKGDAHLLQVVAQPLISNHVAGRTRLNIDSAQDLWRGLAGPPGFTPAQTAFWDAAMARVVKDPEWLKDVERNLMANVYKNSVETLKHWQVEYADVKALFTEMGLAK